MQNENNELVKQVSELLNIGFNVKRKSVIKEIESKNKDNFFNDIKNVTQINNSQSRL